MDLILEGGNIPKVQVERAVSPIIAMFIGNLLTLYLKDITSDIYELVSQEFPLKKDNNQSTNMDYLLLNNKKDRLVFVELKTDVSSFDKAQAEKYVTFKNNIIKNSAKLLSDDLSDILKSSTKKYKYEYLLKQFNKHIPKPEDIKNVLVIYIVPKIIKEKVQNSSDGIDYVLSFGDLPDAINGNYSEEWSIIWQKLKQLDDSQNNPLSEGNISYANIIENVESFAKNRSITPETIKLGNTGGKIRPNYQIRFSNGLEQAFHNNGKIWKEEGFTFTPNNLDAEQSWETFKDNVRND